MVVHRHRHGHGAADTVAAAKTAPFCLTTICTTCPLQGPLSVIFWRSKFRAIRDLAYFGIMQTRLFGRDVMISRTGYTGERGYEIFCRAKMQCICGTAFWTAGKDMGVRPCSSHARYAADRKLSAVLSWRQLRDLPVRRTSPAATRCGSWASTSRSHPTKIGFIGPRTTMPPRAKSASRSTVCNCQTAWTRWKCARVS